MTVRLGALHRRHRRPGRSGPPALSEYTRIPCLSPAFDPEWEAHGAHRRRGRPAPPVGGGPGRGLSTEVVQLPGRTPVLLVDNGGSGDPDRRLRAHGQAAAARYVAPGARPLRAGPRGPSPLRARHGGRRLRTFRGRDRCWRRPAVDRVECSSSSRRARRVAAPTWRPTSSTCGTRIGTPAPGDLPRLGRAQLRPALADLVPTGEPGGHGHGRRADRGNPQRPGRWRGALFVPHPAPHPLAHRGRGDGRTSCCPSSRVRASPRPT